MPPDVAPQKSRGKHYLWAFKAGPKLETGDCFVCHGALFEISSAHIQLRTFEISLTHLLCSVFPADWPHGRWTKGDVTNLVRKSAESFPSDSLRMEAVPLNILNLKLSSFYASCTQVILNYFYLSVFIHTQESKINEAGLAENKTALFPLHCTFLRGVLANCASLWTAPYFSFCGLAFIPAAINLPWNSSCSFIKHTPTIRPTSTK